MPSFLTRGFENIGMRLGSSDIRGRSVGLDQIVDLSDLFILIQFVFFGRRSQRDFSSIAPDPLEQLAHFGERFDLRQVFRAKQLAAIFVQLPAETAQFVNREKHRQKLIGAFADLPTNCFERHFLIELLEGNLPGFSMKIDGIDQRAVDVEDYCFNHNSVFISLRQSFLPGCLGGETLCLAGCPLGVDKDCLAISHSAVMIAPTAALRSEPISPLNWFSTPLVSPCCN